MMRIQYITPIIILILLPHLAYSDKTPIAVHVSNKVSSNDFGKNDSGKKNPTTYYLYLLNILTKENGEPESDLDKSSFYKKGNREGYEIQRVTVKFYTSIRVSGPITEVIIDKNDLTAKDSKKHVRICDNLDLSKRFFKKVLSFFKDGEKFNLEEAFNNKEIYTIP